MSKKTQFFSDEFDSFYISNESKAGTYTFSGGDWRIEE